MWLQVGPDRMRPWVTSDMTLTIRRSKRRTVGFVVRGSEVTVTAPNRMSKKVLLQIIDKKRRWILEKVHFNTHVRKAAPRRSYVTGEQVAYLGRNYRLEVLDSQDDVVRLKAGRLLVPAPTSLSASRRSLLVRQRLVNWYKDKCAAHVLAHVQHLSPKLGAEPSRIEIRDYKSRWGTCNRHGVVRINWRLIVAPSSILEYVVAHEVCHLVHLNHSPDFWALLRTLIPSPKQFRDWLKVHGDTLAV